MTDRLYRSRTERVLFGVAGGVAERLAVDPALVRIAWVLLAFAGGFGVLLYIVMAIVVPEAPEGAMPSGAEGDGAAGAPTGSAWGTGPRPARRDDGRGAMFFGLLLVIGGAWFLARRWLTFIDADLFGPIALIGFGAILLVFAMRRSGKGEG